MGALVSVNPLPFHLATVASFVPKGPGQFIRMPGVLVLVGVSVKSTPTQLSPQFETRCGVLLPAVYSTTVASRLALMLSARTAPCWFRAVGNVCTSAARNGRMISTLAGSGASAMGTLVGALALQREAKDRPLALLQPPRIDPLLAIAATLQRCPAINGGSTC